MSQGVSTMAQSTGSQCPRCRLFRRLALGFLVLAALAIAAEWWSRQV